MQTDASQADPPKHNRRWFQFSLRTLLAIITLFCTWLGIVSHRANRQRAAVDTIKKAGGQVCYDYECSDDGLRLPLLNPPLPPGPDWLRNIVGIDYLATVIYVSSEKAKQVSDDTIAAIAELQQLRCLVLEGTGVTDSGLACLREMSELRVLVVSNSAVTSAGWGPLGHLHNLTYLTLIGPDITDETLKSIKDSTSLTELLVLNTQVTDRGLEHLSNLSQLETLSLKQSENITDSGLRHLKNLTGLKILDLTLTKVTDSGIAELNHALPNSPAGIDHE